MRYDDETTAAARSACKSVVQHRLSKGTGQKWNIKIGYPSLQITSKPMQVDWMSVLDLSKPYDRALFVSALVAMVRIIRRLVQSLPAEEFRRTILQPIDRGHGVTIQFLTDR